MLWPGDVPKGQEMALWRPALPVTQAMHRIFSGISSGMVFLKPGSRSGLNSLSALSALLYAAVPFLCTGMDGEHRWDPEQEISGAAALCGGLQCSDDTEEPTVPCWSVYLPQSRLCPHLSRGNLLAIPIHKAHIHLHVSSQPGVGAPAEVMLLADWIHPGAPGQGTEYLWEGQAGTQPLPTPTSWLSFNGWGYRCGSWGHPCLPLPGGLTLG